MTHHIRRFARRPGRPTLVRFGLIDYAAAMLSVSLCWPVTLPALGRMLTGRSGPGTI